MKELYISPELEILCFLPMEGIATDPEWARTVETDLESTVESLPGDHDEKDPTVDPFG